MSNLVRSMYYEISIGGKKLDLDTMSLIDSVIHEDTCQGSDLLTINLSDPDFVFMDSPMFVEETSVTFKGGWHDEREIEFSGYISVIDIEFPETGTPTLVIHCMDNSHLLDRKRVKKTWQNMKHSDVVKQIFAQYGLKADVDDTVKKIETISQSQQTDMEFLIRLAEEQVDSFIVYIEGDRGYFKKKDVLGPAQETLKYREDPFDIQSFNPRLNKEHKQEEFSESDINSKTKKVDTAKSTYDTPREVQGTPVTSSSKKKPETKLSPVTHLMLDKGKWVTITHEKTTRDDRGRGDIKN